MSSKYILKGHEVVPIEDALEWAKYFHSSDRIVAKTTIGEVMVSTVFLGIDHSFGGKKPLLFETMIFGGEKNGYQERYTTWEEAEKGHKKVVKSLHS